MGQQVVDIWDMVRITGRMRKTTTTPTAYLISNNTMYFVENRMWL
jgi:hypothetical protein